MVDKKTKKDVVGIAALGIGLGVGTAVESKIAPAVPVFPKFAPVAVVAGTVVGAGIVLRQVNKLGQPVAPIRKQTARKLRKTSMFLRRSRGFI